MAIPSTAYRENQSYSSANDRQRSAGNQYDGMYIINFTSDELVVYYNKRGINVKRRRDDKRKSK